MFDFLFYFLLARLLLFKAEPGTWFFSCKFKTIFLTVNSVKRERVENLLLWWQHLPSPAGGLVCCSELP